MLPSKDKKTGCLLNIRLKKQGRFGLLFVVQTDIHISPDDRLSELNGFQPLSIGLALRVNLNFRDQFLHQLPFLPAVHLSVKLVEVDQNLADIIASN